MAAAKKKPDTTTKAGRRQFASSDKWLPYIRKKYGWLVDVYETVPEVAAIIRRGYIQDQPVQDITGAILGSQWANSLGAGEYEYLKGTYTQNEAYAQKIADRETFVKQTALSLGFQLDDAAVKTIAADSLKGAWDENKISSTISGTVVSEAQTGGTVVPGTPGETAPTGLQLSADAASVRSLAKKYGLKFSEAQVEGYVQGLLSKSITSQQVYDQFRNQAKALYPSVSQQLDAGDLESSVTSYTQIAASVLGIDPSKVDYSDTKFGRLLTYQDPKTNESRLMNATEWNRYLRTLPEWKKTGEASTRYDGLIKTIENAFGKVR